MPADVLQTPQQRIVEASVLTPPHGGITGWAGLHWAGATRWFDGRTASGDPLPVPIAVAGENVRNQPGFYMCEERLDPRDVITVDGISITQPVRSVCYEMRYAASERDGALVLSMAAYHDLVSIDELAEYAGRHSGWIGIPRCRTALPLAEENCWSPTEFVTVWIWRVMADLPRPLCNRPVFDRSGRHVGTPDLLDVEAGVICQYDGSLHLDGEQRDLDIEAEEKYRRLGLECLSVRSTHLRNPDDLVERMHAVRSRARWEAESNRAWTVEPPPWWMPTHTVDLRRQLDDVQRRRMLRYRIA